ncbi:MAG: SGNH/GDSL hydrolase N-terminal domain-containing protein, partial [Actinomycetota bacterium]
MRESQINRRQFLAFSAASAASAVGWRAEAMQAAAPRVEGDLTWHDVRAWGVEGKGWSDTSRYFDRLPGRAEGKVRAPVWSLSRHSAGMLARFETDARVIHARYDLLSANLALPHMPATGVSGLDLYARDERGEDRWLAVARPTAQKMNVQLVGNVDPLPGATPRLYSVYLPLYNGITALEIGVPEGSRLDRPAP